jgi:hypothetical protein
LLQRESQRVAAEEAALRTFDIAVTTLALRAAPTKPEERERQLVPAVDEANAAMLDRAAISHERAALIASLWPAPTRQCVAAPVFEELPAPAIFGATYRVTLPGVPQLDARALQQRLNAAFPRAESDVQHAAKSRAA